jgi:translation initiation factor eIF-2B subunit gamma
VTIATIKTTTDEYMGTAETLRTIKDKIKSDFMLISCDIVGQINLRDVLDMHRLRDSDVTCVFAKLPESELTGKRAGVRAGHGTLSCFCAE